MRNKNFFVEFRPSNHKQTATRFRGFITEMDLLALENSRKKLLAGKETSKLAKATAKASHRI